MKSLWKTTAEKPYFEALKGDKNTDVLIIGGGMVGVLCALELHKAGVNYILVEAREIGSGVTKNTTAKITSQHGLIYDKIINEFGAETAKGYFEINQLALEKYRQMCQETDCDFEEKTNFVYSKTEREKIEKEVLAFERIGVKAEFTQDTSLPFKIVGAVGIKNQAQFNPLKFLYSVAKGLNIYENTRVTQMVGNTAITDNGKISAKRVIVATHFPFINKHGMYFMKMYQHRSYVLGLSNTPQVDGMYVDEDLKGLSFRNYGQLLLLGGGSHRTGKKGGNYNELREFAKRNYPNAKEKYFFATQDCKTLDSVPYIGEYSKGTENLYVATGFNKWGMTSSMVSAMLLKDEILEIENPYKGFFNPSRTMLRPQLAVNTFEAVSGLIMPTIKRCPHLGCGLKWNKYEHSWDCPCHGSRFSEKGKLIDNPANGDLK